MTTAVFGVPNADRYSFAMSQFFRKNVELVRTVGGASPFMTLPGSVGD
jgi:hypothetical protein